MRTIKGRIHKPRRAMLYGVAGVGKSTWGASADAPIFLCCEEGANDLDIERYDFGTEDAPRPWALAYSEVIAALAELAESAHEYRTVVIDTLDWLEKLIWASVCARQSPAKDNIEDIGYAKGYKFALTEWKEFLGWCDALRDRGMTILLIAHAKIADHEPPGLPKFDRYTPALHDLACATVVEWCDEVLFVNYSISTVVKEEAFGKKTHDGVGDGMRKVYCSERPAHIAKNRLGMPDEIELDYQAYHAYAGGGVVEAGTEQDAG